MSDRTLRNYFIEKVKEKVLWNERQANDAASAILHIFEEEAFEIENKINAFYQKYAAENQMTLTEARKKISDKEYSVWRKSIEEYLAEIEGNAAESKVLLELNTLAMKGRISREEKLLADIYRTMAEMASDFETNLTELLSDIVTSNYYRGCYNLQRGIKAGFEVGKISRHTVKALLDHNWSGKKYSKAVWDNVDAICVSAQRAIMRGFTSGLGVKKMAKEIDDVMGKGEYVAERLVRTECKYFANQGELLSYKEHGIEKYVYIGGVEGKYNCDCGFYNNKVISIELAAPGVNFPPLHPNCKCSIRAYIEGSILGNGNLVHLDEDISFEDWKKSFAGEDKPLTGEELQALNSYISSESYKINEKLRNRKHLSKAEKEFVKNLESALNKMPVYKGTVYRSVSGFGIGDVDKFIKSHVVGEHIFSNQFLSSSLDVYDSSFPVQYVIQSKHGRDITRYNKGEQEILFARGTVFVIKEIAGNTIYMEER